MSRRGARSGGAYAESFDFVVIGAGSAGCVLANRLSARPGNRVLLLEAGGSDWSPVLAMPAATDLYGIGNPRYDWRYMTEADPTRHGRKDIWPRGKVIGGSSSINGMVYMRGQADDYDSWARLGNAGWSYAEVLPYFRRSETNERGADAYRGGDGPLRVSDLRDCHPLSHLFVESAVAAGLPLNPDFCGGSLEGAGVAQVTQRYGRRHSAADAYLAPARRRPNLEIRKHATASRILFDANRASGVEYLRPDGTPATVGAAGEVILAAGAIGSPQLLLLSGLGGRDELAKLGIETRHHLPGVGRNLQDHVGVYLTYAVNRPTYNSEKGLARRTLHVLNWLLFGRGPATSPGGQGMAFLRSDATARIPDLQIHITPVGYKLTPEALLLHDDPAITIIPNVNRPASRGWIDLAGTDVRQPPRIYPRLLEQAEDLRILIAGCRFARKIAATPPLSRHILEETAPGPRTASDSDWGDFLRRESITIFHPAGTCRMGTDEQAVVDSALRVRGVERLRVIDASIMPHLVSGNTNAPVIMIGEKGADLVLAGP